MRKRYRIGGLASAVVLSVGTSLALGTSAASASNQFGGQYCFINGGYACLNSWNGGPWVDVYTGGPYSNATNNDFAVISSTDTTVEIEDTGPNNWYGKCVGDAYNNSGDADTSLDPCGSDGQGAGWGTQFTYTFNGCAAHQIAFKNVHWGGWLGPPDNWVNGSHFYLNKPSEYCFSEYGLAG